jgi:hypothetical protein
MNRNKSFACHDSFVAKSQADSQKKQQGQYKANHKQPENGWGRRSNDIIKPYSCEHKKAKKHHSNQQNNRKSWLADDHTGSK